MMFQSIAFSRTHGFFVRSPGDLVKLVTNEKAERDEDMPVKLKAIKQVHNLGRKDRERERDRKWKITYAFLIMPTCISTLYIYYIAYMCIAQNLHALKVLASNADLRFLRRRKVVELHIWNRIKSGCTMQIDAVI
jgi:hypothetical protein